MKGFTHRWLGPTGAEPPEAVEPGDAQDALMWRLLWARGYRDARSAGLFLDASLTSLHDPSMLPGVERAAERLLAALRAREPVVIYGDYDVDGVSASAILFHACGAVAPGAPVSTYVPHRIDEGYGLNAAALHTLVEAGARLIISVDCGITAHDSVRALEGTSTDLIITDHHEPSAGGVLPAVYAVVHPRLPGGEYPFGDLCGAGVAFKLAWRLMTMAHGGPRLSPDWRATLLDLLALAALGTIADIVPLVGENRAIARHGLRRLRDTKIHGLTALIEASGLGGEEIDAERVGFTLGPRLNACGRMGHAKDAVELLTTAEPEHARTIARELARLNDARRRTEKRIFDEACAMAEAQGMTGDATRAIVLASPGWHPGVVGIVCSRLIGRFHRPTILMETADGECHGSGRSIDGFNLHAALSRCADLFTRFGGHEMAAGLALPQGHLGAFSERFTAIANERLDPEHLTPALEIDCGATIAELTPRSVERVLGLGPFGRGNPGPRVLLRGVRVAREPEAMGSGGAHLSLFVQEGDREIRLVGWNWGARRSRLRAGARLDAVVEPKLSCWQGRVRVEPTIADVRLTDDAG